MTPINDPLGFRAGKSSVLEALADAYPTVPEPVEQWQDLMEKFYKDPATWTFPFQLKVLMSFVDGKHDKHDASRPVIYERSPLASRYVFGQLLLNDGHFSQSTWDLFKEYYDELAWSPDLIVYIDTPPAECYERIARRGRPCEKDLPPEYLRKIAHQYDLLFKYCSCPCVHVDGTKPLAEVTASVLRTIEAYSSPEPVVSTAASADPSRTCS